MAVPYPSIAADDVGWLHEADMIEVDRVMIEDLHIGLIQMMENAGRSLATLILDRFEPRTVTVLAGSGGNGGGGMVAARHLANRGVAVTVTVAKPESLGPVPAHQLDILRRMEVAIDDRPRSADLVVDALIGYSLRGAPRGRIAELIEAAPELGRLTVALDTPSGVNVTDGAVPGAAVTADATLTLAMPKIGLRHASQVGELYIADISVPGSVYEPLGVGPVPPFDRGPIVQCLTGRLGSV